MTPPINSVDNETRAFIEAVQLVEDAGWVVLRPELAARRAANTPVDGVSIKPLEWGDHDSLSIIAHTVLGPYLVEVINSPRVALWLPNMTGQARKMIEGFDSVEDAKAAAQADFNARIQACLTSPAAEPVAWQPIETAPKTPSEVLLWGVMKGRTQPWKYIGSWFPHRDGGWWVAHAMPIHPTHWMPLPAAPALLAALPERESE